jgi:hypothetical protein
MIMFFFFLPPPSLQVREVVDLNFRLLVAGWEPRTILMFLDLGVLFDDLQIDVRNTARLHDSTGLVIQNVFVVEYRWEGRTHRCYTDAILTTHDARGVFKPRYAQFFEFFGLDPVLYRNPASETKCAKGSVYRGEIRRDFAKWRGMLASGRPLVLFFWSDNGLIVAVMLSPDENPPSVSVLLITRAFYWSNSLGRGANAHEDDQREALRFQHYHSQRGFAEHMRDGDGTLPMFDESLLMQVSNCIIWRQARI